MLIIFQIKKKPSVKENVLTRRSHFAASYQCTRTLKQTKPLKAQELAGSGAIFVFLLDINLVRFCAIHLVYMKDDALKLLAKGSKR